MNENEGGVSVTTEMGAEAEGATAEIRAEADDVAVLLLLNVRTSALFLLVAPFTRPKKRDRVRIECNDTSRYEYDNDQK